MGRVKVIDINKISPEDRDGFEELWGPLEQGDITRCVPTLGERIKMGAARVLYKAETDITYALKMGRFRNKPSGPER